LQDDQERNPFETSGIVPEVLAEILRSNRSDPLALQTVLGGLKRAFARALHPDTARPTDGGAVFDSLMRSYDNLLGHSTADLELFADDYLRKKPKKSPRKPVSMPTSEPQYAFNRIDFLERVDAQLPMLLPNGTELKIAPKGEVFSSGVKSAEYIKSGFDVMDIREYGYVRNTPAEIADLETILPDERFEAWAQSVRHSDNEEYPEKRKFYVRKNDDKLVVQHQGYNDLILDDVAATSLKPGADYEFWIGFGDNHSDVVFGKERWDIVVERANVPIRMLGTLDAEYMSILKGRTVRQVYGTDTFAPGATPRHYSAIPAGDVGRSGGILSSPEEISLAEKHFSPSLVQGGYLLISTKGELRVPGMIQRIIVPSSDDESPTPVSRLE
jgi:hypothetical protein